MDKKLPDVKSILEELKLRWEAKLEGSNIYNSAEGEVDEAKEEGEGASNPGEGDEDAGGSEAGNRASGDGSVDAPASKKQKTSNDQQAKQANGGDSTSSAKPDGGEKQTEKEKDKDGLDSDLEDDEAGEDDVQNMVLAQYDKVVRNKNKWKCTMKNGIVHIDGREYVFSKATGEFVF